MFFSVVHCVGLTAPLHGSMIGNDTRHGSIFSFQCAPGYKLNGSPAIQCKVDGTWNVTQPICPGM